MIRPRSKMSRLWVMGLLVWIAWAVVPLGGGVSGQTVRTVRGEVVVVNVKETPPVIVVKARTGKQQELIVGASVESGAAITRDKQPIDLRELKVGETVELSYVKNPDGLVVRAIHATRGKGG